MKLKKMAISGFKSFADKTNIDFPAGVCAIVGPNGCGKSNIVDALKWAMGEQSAKQLRGKAMEDVIFAGTNGKPPLNMAEVSLILKNDNGNAPEELRDFSEIMLTRRLYRSGESAFFLNKRPCRLKDIHNLFLGSGMGSKSYAVIQQGSIGKITEAVPEERRFFIEDAAGVTRYKTRKNEATRKIDYTRQNLLRVSDIVTEVEKNMAALKRQAKKADLYNKLREKAKTLDVRLSIFNHDEYTKSIEDTESLLKELKDANIAHVSKLKRLDAAVEDIKLQRNRKNEDISRQKAKKFEAQRGIDRMENDLSHSRTEVERLGNEITELKAARVGLEEKNKNIITDIAREEEQVRKLREEVESVRVDLGREKADSAETKERLSEANKKLNDEKSLLMDLVAREASYRNMFQNVSNSRENLKRQLKTIAEDEALAARDVSEAENRTSRADEDLRVLKREKEEFAEQIGAMKKALDEKNEELGTQVRAIHELDLERSRIRSRHTELKKMEDSYEWYKDGVKAIMKRDAGEESQSTGILGLTADVVRPEPSYEMAAEAVLGESLQYVLVDEGQTALEAIGYLQSSGEGRSGFIPVSSIKPGRKAGENHDADRLLVNHVSVKEGFERIAEAFFDGVVVAKDMNEAASLATGNGFKAVVTLDGNLISDQGVMVGGSSENLSGILVKKQEIETLQTRISELDGEILDGRTKQNTLESEVQTMEIELQQTVERKDEVERDEVDAEKEQYRASEDLKQARRKLESIRIEQERLQDEEDGIDSEMDKQKRALSEVENEVKAKRESVEKTSAEIETVSAEMEEYNQRIVELKLSLSTINANLENSGNVLRRLRDFNTDGVARLEQLSRDIELKSERMANSKAGIERNEGGIGDMYEELAKLDNELEKNEDEFREIDSRLKESGKSISEIRTKREETTSKISVLELDQSQRKIKRDAIANRIVERYHQSIEAFRMEYKEIFHDEAEPEKLEQDLEETRKKLSKIHDVNLGAIKAYEEQKSRHEFLCEQREDLVKAMEDLQKVIRKINRITQERFLATFEQINEKLGEVFPRLFDGGSAKLVLTQPEKPLETGVEFMVHPPGKKLTRLTLLSGGEKALSAIAFIFSIFLIKPASFCIMDEIDAPLDEANVFRFNELLKIIGEKAQIIMITHSKRTMEFADTLFGVTMEKKGVSKVVSVNLDGKKEEMNGVQLV